MQWINNTYTIIVNRYKSMCDKEKSKGNQKYISEGILKYATMTASIGIGQLYSKNTCTHPSEN